MLSRHVNRYSRLLYDLSHTGPTRLFAKPIPSRFRHAAIFTQQIIDRFINRDMTLWDLCPGRNQFLDDRSVI